MRLIAVFVASIALAVLSLGQNTLGEYQRILRDNPRSSLAHYGIGEIYFQQHSYQAATNEFRNALNGDRQPKWTEVWSHIGLGKVFDVTGQRARAIDQYERALKTDDNTHGALAEAQKYLNSPYKQ